MTELFDEFEKLKSRKEKLAFLVANKENGTLRAVLQGTFDPNIQWKIKVPEYEPDAAPIGLNPSNLFTEMSKCTIFAEGHPKSANVTPERMKEILIQTLSSMNKGESSLFEQMLKKKSKVKGLTEKLVLEVFPDLYREV